MEFKFGVEGVRSQCTYFEIILKFEETQSEAYSELITCIAPCHSSSGQWSPRRAARTGEVDEVIEKCLRQHTSG